MRRHYRIATLARRFRLLADRPELCCDDKAELIERLLAQMTPVSELDRTLVLHAGEADLLCAHAVRVLRERSVKPLLDTLGTLDPDRIAALYFALPPKRRVTTLRDPTWAYCIANTPPETEDAIADVTALAAETQAMQSERARNGANNRVLSEARTHAEQHERHALHREVGLPVELLDAEKPAVILAIFTKELKAIDDPDDDVEFSAACARAVARCGALA